MPLMKVDPRFLTAQGAEIFNGNELLVKGALETDGGVHLLSGYPGSPAAAFFDVAAGIKDLLNDKGIHAAIATNEALAAAMLNGSQALGCRGIIAMKSVGVHVAADALAMGNLAGAHVDGGAIVVYGDDPWSDSTQCPADSRYISKHLFIPTIEPSTPQEIKDFIDLSFKLSRMSQLFVGYVATTNLLDGGGSVQCRPNQYPRLNTRNPITFDTASIDYDKRVLLPPRSIWQEENYTDRLARAAAAARTLGLNQILFPAAQRKSIGFATSGMAHGYVIQALYEMGVLGEYPILKFGLSYPVDAEMLRQFTQQCERIVVIEERRGFLEEQIAEILFKDRQANRPSGKTEVWGKGFPANLKGFPDTKGLHPSLVISRLVPLLKFIDGSKAQITVPDWAESLDRELETIDSTGLVSSELSGLPPRLPTFCPGCPHRDTASALLQINKEFKDPRYMRETHGRGVVDLLFHGDAGCYIMMMFPPNVPLMHDYSGMGLGGGTGAGMDPFIRNKKVAMMGDGTFFHSGQLAVGQALKLRQDITFIIYDNRTIGMTGHQPSPGVEHDIMGRYTPPQDIEEVVRGIAGPNDVTILRVDPTDRVRYKALLEEVLLADGLKVIIVDKECGITSSRRRKRAERAVIKQRGFLPTSEHQNVNSDICRFCLTCGEMAGCPALKHTDTEYGPKMDTDVTGCVACGACERIGACSAFERVTIKRKRPPKSRVPELGLDNIPEPQRREQGDLWRCCLVGVGGMGIGLATSIVVRAGHNEGFDVIFMDKKGLAIRNGSVASQVVFNITNKPVTAIIPFGKADLLLGVDILEAARVLDPRGRTRVASRERTAAVINTDKVGTSRTLTCLDNFSPADLERLIREHTRQEDFLARNISRICEKYLGSKLYANIMMLGFAFQKGLIPVSMHSMAWAIKDTIRADFRKNLYAFNMGRKLVVQNDLFQGPPKRSDWREVLEDKCRSTIRRYVGGQKMADELRHLCATLVDNLKELDDAAKLDVVVRVYDCMRWGGLAYARQYASLVERTYGRDRREANFAATRAVIANLASAMLIKDAVFLAELSTSPDKHARDREKYNVNRANGDRIVYRHLWHVPIPLGKRKRTLSVSPRHWMLQVLKYNHWVRPLLPGYRSAVPFLRQYVQKVESFAWATLEEYARGAAELGSPQCMNCMNPRCQEAGCPLHANVPAWVDMVYQGQWQQAAELLHADNNFPEFTSRICPALCQGSCKHGLDGYAVPVRDIERQIVDRAFAEGFVKPQPAARKSGKKVAVIGSGPAGLAAAQQLARCGHEVVVFDHEAAPGGLLRYGIPAFRLEKELIDRRVAQLQAEGVTFRCATTVGRDITGQQLRQEFNAILLATGASRPRDLGVPGRQHSGVVYALDFLRSQGQAGQQPLPVEIKGKSVAVIGGGETGNDCVETALLAGAREVHQLEILPQPGNGQCSVGVAHEGLDKAAPVHRSYCVATKEFQGNGSGLSGLKAVQVRWQLTTTGKRMQEVPGSEFSIPADLAVLALGFEPVVEPTLATELGMTTDAQGRAVLRDYATSVPGIFAAGDVVKGASIVASAIHSGRRAAAKMDEYLNAK